MPYIVKIEEVLPEEKCSHYQKTRDVYSQVVASDALNIQAVIKAVNGMKEGASA